MLYLEAELADRVILDFKISVSISNNESAASGDDEGL